MRWGFSEWEERLRPVLDEEGAELLDTQVSGGRKSLHLRFFVDRVAGVGIDDLARVSRKIGLVLDADPTLAGGYDLEVSSPGMNRVVRTEANFRRFAVERVSVRLAVPVMERTHLDGVIESCAGGVARVNVQGLGSVAVPLERIERAELRLDPRRPPKRGEAVERARPDGEVREDGE
jgi:ribosome maturation factor RimP